MGITRKPKAQTAAEVVEEIQAITRKARKPQYDPVRDMLGDDLDSGTLPGDTASPSSHNSTSKGYVSCHANHKELSIGGGTILGASCNSPRPGYDVYIGFDYGMKVEVQAPWSPVEAKLPLQGKFLIPDMSTPKDIGEFNLMLDWLIAQLAAGKRVHIGCIGGHGRTGLVLAALVSKVNGEKDAIQWVRTHHCKKAVESKSQVEWLVKHFGVTTAPASKGWSSDSWDKKYPQHGGGMGMSDKSSGGKAVSKADFAGAHTGGTNITQGMRLMALKGPSSVFPGA